MDAYRFLRLTPNELYAITPREFKLLMKSAQELQYDEYERMSMSAMMNRQAYHSKKLSMSDLFKRPVNVQEAEKKAQDLIEQQREAAAYLAQFKFEVS